MILKEVYLDNAATTKVSESAIKKACFLMQECFGNPSSLHTKGFLAERELEGSRKIIAKSLFCKDEEVFFTSGATEANNIAIQGCVAAKKKFGNKIITTSVEHPSVFNTFKELEKKGFNVVFLKPNKEGFISEETLRKEIDKETILVSMMLINNEIGCFLPVDLVRKVIEEKKLRTLLHVDAVQAYGKIKLDVKKLGVDLLSVSAHKVNGPKGVGVLYKSKNTKIELLIFGGEQEKGLRPGTESLPLIGAFSEAVGEFDIDKNYDYIQSIRDYAVKNLKDIKGVKLNSSGDALPYIINFSVKNLSSGTLMRFLSEKNVFVSSGSACLKGKKSRVLKEFGFSDDVINSSIRVSFSKNNTKEDVDILIKTLKEGLKQLVKN